MIGADVALWYFWGGVGRREVFSRISGYQKHVHPHPLAVNIGV